MKILSIQQRTSTGLLIETDISIPSGIVGLIGGVVLVILWYM